MNIVAGGYDESSDRVPTVELNIAGENSWTYGSQLPKALTGLRGVSVMSQFYVIGRY